MLSNIIYSYFIFYSKLLLILKEYKVNTEYIIYEYVSIFSL